MSASLLSATKEASLSSPSRTVTLSGIAWHRLLASKALQGVMIAHCTHNYGFYVLLSWLPKYFMSLGVKLDDVGSFAMAPYITIFLVDNAWGLAIDTAISRGRLSRLSARKLSQSVAFIVPALLLAVLATGAVTSPVLANVLITFALGMNSVSHSGYWANLVDLAPRDAGVLCGISNTLATLPGVFGNLITGFMLELTGSWNMVFGLFVFLYLAGQVVSSMKSVE